MQYYSIFFQNRLQDIWWDYVGLHWRFSREQKHSRRCVLWFLCYTAVKGIIWDWLWSHEILGRFQGKRKKIWRLDADHGWVLARTQNIADHDNQSAGSPQIWNLTDLWKEQGRWQRNNKYLQKPQQIIVHSNISSILFNRKQACKHRNCVSRIKLQPTELHRRYWVNITEPGKSGLEK